MRSESESDARTGIGEIPAPPRGTARDDQTNFLVGARSAIYTGYIFMPQTQGRPPVNSSILHRCLNLLAPCDHGVKVDGYREGGWGSGGLRFRKDLSAEGAGKKKKEIQDFSDFFEGKTRRRRAGEAP